MPDVCYGCTMPPQRLLLVSNVAVSIRYKFSEYLTFRCCSARGQCLGTEGKHDYTEAVFSVFFVNCRVCRVFPTNVVFLSEFHFHSFYLPPFKC
jgi:hypothetical protein